MVGPHAADGASTGLWEIRKAAGLSLACGSQRTNMSSRRCEIAFECFEVSCQVRDIHRQCSLSLRTSPF